MNSRKLLVVIGIVVFLGMTALITSCGTPSLEYRMNYQGRLTSSRGGPIDGNRTMTFRLFQSETGGSAIWSESHSNVPVTNGLFNVVLGSNNALDESEFHRPLWLEIVVAGQTLSARQPLYGAPYAFSLVPGAVIKGNIAKTETYSSTLSVANFGNGQALAGYSLGGIGAYFEGGGQGRNSAALRVYNRNATQGMATYMVNKSNFATAHFSNSGTGEVLYLTNGGTNSAGSGGGDFITARNQPENDTQFRVRTDGRVFADAGYSTGAGDVAEMLPAVEGLEPGDTLVIGPQGKLTRSTKAYQPTVVGVYSTAPGFIGGQPVDQILEDHVPLAIAGIVPVRATAENGAIQLGDLLTTSSTPGHAMKATQDRPGTIIGKALGELASGTGTVNILIMLR